MFVLIASAQVKPNAGGEFERAFQDVVVPSLRAQPGFRDVLLLVVPGGPEVVAVTFWRSREEGGAFEDKAWPSIVEALADVLDRPIVKHFQLAHSTLHPLDDAAFPVQSPITTEPTGVGA